MAEGNSQFGPWTLSEAEQTRLKSYIELRALIASKAGEQDKNFQRDKGERPNSHVPQMYVNAAGLVCRAAADLMLPEEPKIRSADGNEEIQKRIDALAARSRIYSLAWRAAYWTSGLGDGYLTIADVPQSADRKTSLPVLSFRRAVGALARNVRPEDPPFNRQFLFRSCLPGGVELFALHTAGKIEYSAFKGRESAPLPEGYQPSIETKELVPLVVHMAALRGDDDDEAFGESDFDGTQDFIFEIANRLRQVARILDMHGDPPMNVPDGMLDEGGKLDIRKKKVFERGVGGEGAEYITWQSQLDAAYSEMDRLLKIIALLTETPLALWGMDEDGQAESGRALKFRLLSGLGKARRSGSVLKEVLSEGVRLALRREDILAGKTPGNYGVAVELSDKFIADEVETSQTVQTLRAAKSMSIRAGVQMGQGLTGAELDAEVAAIEAETQAEAPLPGLEANRFGQ